MPLIINDETLAMFRNLRNQTLFDPDQSKEPKKAVKKKKSDYDIFLEKYNDLENEIDNFNHRDIVHFFCETAKQSGVKYVIANWARELSIVSVLLENYSVHEICLMVEFLFFSDQDYLQKNGLGLTVLKSGWLNKIYADSQLWADDKYKPQKRLQEATREWTGDEEKSVAGKWRR